MIANKTHSVQINSLKERVKNHCKVNVPIIDCVLGVNSLESCKTLLDSGSSRSLISKQVCEQLLLSHNLKFKKINVTCTTANRSILKISKCVVLKIRIENFCWKFEFLVSDTLLVPVILGADFIRFSQLVLDMSKDEFYFRFNPNFKFKTLNNVNNPTTLGNIEDSSCEFRLNENQFTKREISRLQEVVNEFSDVLTTKLGQSRLGEYKINMTDLTPVKRSPYQLSPQKMEIMREKINKMLKENVIEHSNSSFSSPAFLVPKPNGDFRLVIDYRALNKKIAIDCNPLPDIHTSFHWFNQAKYFTVIDLNQGYYQMTLSKESRQYTAFNTPWGLYEHRRLPFGLAVGAAALSQMLDLILGDLKYKYVFSYLDDVIVYSENFEEHIAHITEVFSRLRKAGLTVNPNKLKLAEQKIPFLGHLVSYQGVSIDPERTRSIREFPPPSDGQGIARFIGMVGYYAKFIPEYAKIAAPLNELRKKNVKFYWSKECDVAFKKLKESIASPPVLRMANFNEEFILQTDASRNAIAAVLMQKADGILQPVSYASRKLSQAEQKYSIYELEGLAVVFGFEKFNLYLAHRKFILQTDNSALSWVLNHPKQVGKIARWILKIQDFKFDVEHIRGTQNIVADTLSRMYQTNKVEQKDKVNEAEMSSMLLSDFPVVFEDFLEKQKEDPELLVIINKLKENEDVFPYSLNKGMLVVKVRNLPDLKIVVPNDLKKLIFKYFHDTISGGHLGIFKTTEKIKQKFTWKGLNQDITRMVKQCLLCAKSKPAQQTNVGFLASKVASKPLERLYIDFVGKLPRTSRGNTMIFSVIDAFSKFCWLIPIREPNSNSVIRELKNIFTNFSIPEVIVSDNGSAFTSKAFRNFCFNLGIKHVTCTEYYARSNMVERLHRNLKSALISFNSEKQTKWDDTLVWLPLAFNTAKHESIGYVPYEIIFRHKPRTSLDNIWNLDELLPPQFNADSKDVWLKAKQNLLKAHQRSGERYNKNRHPIKFQIDDLVMLQAHPKSSKIDKRAAKLCMRWKGPYRIVKWLTPVTVGLRDVRENNGHSSDSEFQYRAHVSQIKLFRKGNEIAEVETVQTVWLNQLRGRVLNSNSSKVDRTYKKHFQVF